MSKTPIAKGTRGTITPGVAARRDAHLDGARVEFMGFAQGYPWVRLLEGSNRKPFVWSTSNVQWSDRT